MGLLTQWGSWQGITKTMRWTWICLHYLTCILTTFHVASVYTSNGDARLGNGQIIYSIQWRSNYPAQPASIGINDGNNFFVRPSVWLTVTMPWLNKSLRWIPVPVRPVLYLRSTFMVGRGPKKQMSRLKTRRLAVDNRMAKCRVLTTIWSTLKNTSRGPIWLQKPTREPSIYTNSKEKAKEGPAATECI